MRYIMKSRSNFIRVIWCADNSDINTLFRTDLFNNKDQPDGAVVD